MSVNDGRQREVWPRDDAPTGGPAGGGAVVSRLPAPPNARADGLDEGAASLAAFLAGAVEAPAASVPAASGRAAHILFAARARQARRRRARRTFGTSAALGALAAAGFVAWIAVSRLPPALSYTVDGASPLPGGYVRSSAGHEPEVAFSDGTSIRVLPSTRARVLDVGRRGARLMLEDGRAHVHVAHRPGADWQVQAGAVVIHVHGASFFVEWNSSQSRLDLQMESGVVSVDGPRPGDTVVLRGGQSLRVRSDGSRVVAATQPTLALRESAGQERENVPGAVEATSPPESMAPVDAPRPAAGPSPPPRRWSERLTDGEAAGIVAEARRRGIANVLAGAGSEDLAALADAARFRKQDQLAWRVLLAQRRRFPGTLRAEEASFLLGRLADGAGGRGADALSWYNRYLREAPSGAYAAEAMGRMMLVLERQQRNDQARAVAAAYLRRFPQGVYARAARALSSPGR
jgi:hypothetical protein